MNDDKKIKDTDSARDRVEEKLRELTQDELESANGGYWGGGYFACDMGISYY